MSIIVLSAAIISLQIEIQQYKKEEVESLSTAQQVSAFKEIAAKPIYLPPASIEFKGKTIEVIEINVEDDGTLGVPKEWQKAGWFVKSVKPGETGNSIIDGHYDTNTGAPAAFWELKDLQVGDKVTLTDNRGFKFIYQVSNKAYIDIKDPDRTKVLDGSTDKILTLITCGGIWDYRAGMYNKRLVITANFDKMEKSF